MVEPCCSLQPVRYVHAWSMVTLARDNLNLPRSTPFPTVYSLVEDSPGGRVYSESGPINAPLSFNPVPPVTRAAPPVGYSNDFQTRSRLSKYDEVGKPLYYQPTSAKCV